MVLQPHGDIALPLPILTERWHCCYTGGVELKVPPKQFYP